MAVVEAILVRASGNAPAERLERAEVGADGIPGDRYENGTGTFYKPGKSGQALTLIEAEALEGLALDTGIELSPEQAGRNIVTRGIGLNDLVGREFRVGTVLCRGDRLCDPCRPLERRTQSGVLRGLAGRGGLRADVLAPGVVAVGDAIVAP